MSSHNSQLQSSQQTATPLVSVIVPCYNAARFLHKCFKSIAIQTYQNLEILLVNDGSTDNTLSILQEFAAQDDRVRIVNMPQNRGVQWARFEGIKAAKGDWIMIVDGDDYMESDYVQSLLKSVLDADADIASITGNYAINKRLQFLRSKRYKVRKDLVGRVISHEEFYEHLLFPFFQERRPIYAVTWAYLYKAALFDGYNPPEKTLRRNQDILLNFEMLSKAKSIVFVDYIGYNYRYGGFVKVNPKYMEDWWDYYYEMMRIIKEKQLPPKLTYTVASAHAHYIHHWTQYSIAAGQSDEEIAQQLSKELQREEWNEVFELLHDDQSKMTELTRQKDVKKIIEYNHTLTASPFRLFIHRLLNS